MINQKNIYNYENWFQEFQSLEVGKRLISESDYIVKNYRELSIMRTSLENPYEDARGCCVRNKIGDITPYYYIQWILEQTPKSIIDLGCGYNVFKSFIPGITGVDRRDDRNADIIDTFNAEFCKKYYEQFDALISINTIHFSSIETITKRLLMVASLIKKGGRGFVTFNVETWLMYTDITVLKLLFGEELSFSLNDILEYINKQVLKTNLNLLVYDWPILNVSEDATIRDDFNGNIRLVFERY
jgi:hypothetical protein